MVEYVCNKCSRTFNHKGNYLYHINRKNSCTAASDKLEKLLHDKPRLQKILGKKLRKIETLPENIYDNILPLETEDVTSLTIYNPEFTEPNCVYCNKRFMTNSHRNRHMNAHCCIRKKYVDMLKNLDKELENLLIENKFLRNKCMNLYGDNYIFPFGTEKFSNFDINLVCDVIKNPYKGIPDLIESHQFNPLEKKYNNLKIKNPRSSHLEIYNGMNWVLETRENVIQTLIRTYKDAIDNEIDNVTQLLPSNIIKNYNDFSEYIDYYISYLIYDTDLTALQKKMGKAIYNKLYNAMEIMLINSFRKELFNKIEEEIMKQAKRIGQLSKLE